MSGFCYLLTTELKIVYLVSINYYIIIVTTNTELDPKTGLESGNLIPTNSMLIHVLTYIYISKFKVYVDIQGCYLSLDDIYNNHKIRQITNILH